MKKLILPLLTLILFACSDGDLQIEIIDFNEENMEFCGTADISTELFFKIRDNESLILELQSGLLQNEASTDTILSSIPGQSQLIYRTFNGDVSNSYFCDAFPPANPSVVEEITAGADDAGADFALYPVTRAFLPTLEEWPLVGESELNWITASAGKIGKV